MLINDPVELSKKQKLVYDAIKFLGVTSDKKISQFLHWPINTVTPRRGELVKLGLLTKCGTDLDQVTKRPVLLWGVLR
jgi:hypothetical protein